jgi:hypothetical protein
MSDLQAVADRVEIEALCGERLQGLLEFSVRTRHPGTIQLAGGTTSDRAYLCELGRFRDGSSQLDYAIYHNRYQRTGEGWKLTERIYEVRYLDTTLAGSTPRAAGVPVNPPIANPGVAEARFARCGWLRRN